MTMHCVLAVHIESKMTIFTSELLPGFRLFFSGKFTYDYAFVWTIAVLLSSIATDEWDKFANTSLPLRNSAAASSCCGLR